MKEKDYIALRSKMTKMDAIFDKKTPQNIGIFCTVNGTKN